jgi:hypothetical protein
MDPRMSFKQLADETLAKAWEHYHGFMIDLPTAAWKIGNSTRDSTVGCHKKLRSTLMPLLEEPSSCSTPKKRELFSRSFPLAKRESEEYGLKENSCTIEIDPLIRKFQGMPLIQPAASETHQAEQKILAQPSNGKKMPMSRISRNAISTSFGIC